MTTKRYLLVCLIAAMLGGGNLPTATARVVRSRADVASHPRVIRYDVEKDQFVHQSSSLSMVSKNRPGGEIAYSGSRLNQFQYHGKPGSGGIYDALEVYKRRLNHDRRGYEYRRH